MTDLIKPTYYKQCSLMGQEILNQSGFPHTDKYDSEAKEVIKFLGNDFNLGNGIKYLWRLENKKGLFPWLNKKLVERDLKKALYYFNEYIQEEMSTDTMGKWVFSEIFDPPLWVTNLPNILVEKLRQL